MEMAQSRRHVGKHIKDNIIYENSFTIDTAIVARA